MFSILQTIFLGGYKCPVRISKKKLDQVESALIYYDVSLKKFEHIKNLLKSNSVILSKYGITNFKHSFINRSFGFDVLGHTILFEFYFVKDENSYFGQLTASTVFHDSCGDKTLLARLLFDRNSLYSSSKEIICSISDDNLFEYILFELYDKFFSEFIIDGK